MVLLCVSRCSRIESIADIDPRLAFILAPYCTLKLAFLRQKHQISWAKVFTARSKCKSRSKGPYQGWNNRENSGNGLVVPLEILGSLLNIVTIKQSRTT